MNDATIRYLEDQIPKNVDTAIILGSGLGLFAERVTQQLKIHTHHIPNYPHSTVEGHAGLLIYGNVGSKKILVFQGRIHRYEGYSFEDVVTPVKIAHYFGAKEIILTNAAGGLHPQLRVGDFMLIDDYLISPFENFNHPDVQQSRFSLLSNKFLLANIPSVQQAALDAAIALNTGKYFYVSGPSYETRSEIRAFRKMGADAAGMSTVPEIMMAIQLQMRTIAIACITNSSSEAKQKITHDDVTRVANKIGDTFNSLLVSIIHRINI